MLFRNDLDELLAFEEQTRAEALDRLKSLLGNGGKATTETAEIVKGARYGRIDRLFLSDDQKVWGFFNESEHRVVAHRERSKATTICSTTQRR